MEALHQRLGVALLVVGAAGAVWAFAGWRRGEVDPACRAYARLTLLALLVQAGLGTALALRGNRPAEPIHFFYGPSVLLAMLAGIVLGAGDDRRREAVVLVVGFLGVLLLGIRAVGTGG